jgi:hypothetical protein
MSVANPLWGAPRIHGELLKLGVDVGQTTVAKYMARRRRPPSQGWKTFLRNHADGIASIDAFVVATIWIFGPAAFATAVSMAGRHGTSERGMDHPSIDPSLRLERTATLYHSRSRQRLWRGFHSMAQSDGHTRPPNLSSIALANGLVERVIGSIRQDCLDQVVIFGEQHLHSLSSYLQNYNEVRPQLSLRKDAPIPCEAKRAGRVRAQPILAEHTIGMSESEISDKDMRA